MELEVLIQRAEEASRRRDWSTAVECWERVVELHGANPPKTFRTRMWRAQQALNSERAVVANRERFKAIADPKKILWVDPSRITLKIASLTDVGLYPNAILPGDWDLRVMSTTETVKYRSLHDHFVRAVPWQDTQLFAVYAKRMGEGDAVRGCRTLDELLRKYSAVDALYENMERNGFALPQDATERVDYLPHVHIDRHGRILYGRTGNHRLTIAKILKLPQLAGLVHARHLDWQLLREKLHRKAQAGAPLPAKLATHPDLQDMLEPEGRSTAP